MTQAIDEEYPKILGDDDPRADTRLVARVSTEIIGGTIGAARVDLFASVDSGDRDGVVLRFLIQDHGGCFTPQARTIHVSSGKNQFDGIELHLAGGGEARCLLECLQKALDKNK